MQYRKSYWLLYLALALCLTFPLVSGATNYVIDPNNCPSSDGTNFPGQNCAPEDICGDSSGTAQCYDTSTIGTPGSTDTTYSTNVAGFDGGWIMDCYIATSSSEPFCFNDGLVCDRNSTCFSTRHVRTQCDSGAYGASQCTGTCGGTYFACDGSTTDADGCEIEGGVSCGSGTGTIQEDECFSASAGNCTATSGNNDCDDDDSDGNENTCNGANGCEITDGDSCTINGLPGTYLGCSGGAGLCVLTPQHHLTNQSAIGSSDHANLWSVQFGSGDLLNLTTVGANNVTFRVNNSGCLFYPDGTSMCTASAGGGFGDVFVNESGDTMTGNLSFSTSPVNFIKDLRGIETIGSSSFFFDGVGVNPRWFFRTPTHGTILVINDTMFDSNVLILTNDIHSDDWSNVTVDQSQITDLFGDVFVNESGDTMTGDLNMSANDILSLDDITINGQLLKVFSDGNDIIQFGDVTGSPVNYMVLSNSLSGNGVTIASFGDDSDVGININPKGVANISASTSRIVSVVDPVSPQDVATKNYVDNSITPHILNRSSIDKMIYAPDYVNDVVPLLYVSDQIYANGINITALSITLPSFTAYTMGFHTYSGNAPAFVNVIEEVVTNSTSAFNETIGDDINNLEISKNQWVMLSIPNTDVDWVGVQVIYDIL